MNKEEFEEETKNLGIDLTEEQKDQLEKFYQIMIEENKKINLTRIIEKDDVYLKHFYDSLTLIKEIDLTKVETLCDVGSGAGFPGMILKIVFPHLKITLLDSLLKRVNYLNKTIKKLNLENIKAIHTRSEDYQEQFDIVTSRAVANLKRLIPWCIHLVKKNGLIIAMKGNVEQELINIQPVLKRYHCEIKSINKFLLPKEKSSRALVLIKKI